MEAQEIERLIAGHLQKGLRETAEARIWEAAPHYLWFWRDGKEKRGLCSACWQMMRQRGGSLALSQWDAIDKAVKDSQEANGFYGGKFPDLTHWNWKTPYKKYAFTHKAFGHCPLCGAAVEFLSENMRRKYMQDTVFLCHYSRSRQEPETRIMTLWQARIDWAGWRPETMNRPEMETRLREACLLPQGQPGQRYVCDEIWTADYDAKSQRAREYKISYAWKRLKECKGGYAPGEYRPLNAVSRQSWVRDEESATEAFGGSCAERALAAAKLTGPYIDAIDVYAACARYPCMEYLAKMGFTALCQAIVDRKAGKEMNLRGKTAQKVLRIDGATWGWLRGLKQKPDLSLLALIHARDKCGLRIGNAPLLLLHAPPLSWQADDLRALCGLLPPGKREKALRWLLRRPVGGAISKTDYLDHLTLIRALNEDPMNDQVTMPRDFADMHAKLAQRAAHLRKREKDQLIEKRAEKLGEYWFSACGFVLRPMLSAQEIVREGTILKHCVGGYVERYATGGTILCCLREEARPWEPLYTVEYSTAGRRVQVRGYKNGWNMEGWKDGTKMDDQERLETFWRLFALYQEDYRKTHKAKKGSAAA